VVDMGCMFSNCQALESLDISNFNMEKVTSSDNMFFGTGSLYYTKTSNKTSIMVTNALKSVLESMNVSTGSYAEYDIIDNLPG
jgi:surface protein